ncbi:beta-ketoacyl-[acyl-carrier-protein] synthase family protein [Silvibacterium acidisoli]|uniref:beta-ketoacyl-[acyl-carrier-protein] synthase family protein n=1 Tax=Acidobacteriaceae bacterium ZG23-2 TaxID=2883246 RepID=UPI00406D1E2C
MAHRVVITGMGCVSGMGVGVEALWDGLMRAQSAITPTHLVAGQHQTTLPAVRVAGYCPLNHFTADELIMRDRYAQFAIVAAREAVQQAGLGCGEQTPGDTGVVLGSGGGGELAREEAAVRMFYEGKIRCNPITVPKVNNQASVGLVSMEFGFTGPSFIVATGCAAATHAMCQAYLLIQSGVLVRALTGGTEAPVMLSVFQAFDAARVMSHTTCRPFSRDRDGMVIGEGGAVVVMEELQAARARGANILAEVCGIGMSSDASNTLYPTEAGPAQAITCALAMSRIHAEEVDYVNAHGTGTQANDRIETAAIRRALGHHADNITVSSTKALHGHAFGGAGGIELVATVLALQHGVAPPTANYLGHDEGCDLDYAPNAPRERRIDMAIKQSFAFGGVNAVLALRRDIRL